MPLTVQESYGRIRLCPGTLAHGDGPTLQDAADDLVQRLLTYANLRLTIAPTTATVDSPHSLCRCAAHSWPVA